MFFIQKSQNLYLFLKVVMWKESTVCSCGWTSFCFFKIHVKKDVLRLRGQLLFCSVMIWKLNTMRNASSNYQSYFIHSFHLPVMPWQLFSGTSEKVSALSSLSLVRVRDHLLTLLALVWRWCDIHVMSQSSAKWMRCDLFATATGCILCAS